VNSLASIVILTGLSGFLSALAASFFLALGERRRGALLPHLVSFATGALLGAAFLGLLPHAVESIGRAAHTAWASRCCSGVLTFFLLRSSSSGATATTILRNALTQPRSARRRVGTHDPGG